MVNPIKSMMSSPRALNHWIKCITLCRQTRLQLFCFHYAGGNAYVFRSWANQLLEGVDVYAIELPGHGTRLAEPALDRMDPLIQALKAALLPHLKPPFAFLGHSMGALVSYELAQALRQTGISPSHLFVSGHRAPHLPDADAPIHALPDDAFLDALRRYNGTPEPVLQNAELMALMLPTLRADFALLESYVCPPRPSLVCSISALGGLQDWRTSPESLEAWRKHTQAKFLLHWFSGDHFFIHSGQPAVLDVINTTLANLFKI